MTPDKTNAQIDGLGVLPGASDPEKLRAYTKLKLEIAGQLRALIEILKKRGSDARLHRCEELMVKLAEDRFTLAVLGQFKRGKSSLMNAIIGRELLPTGVLPLTSAITVLKFGPVERLVIQRDDLQFPEVAPLSALADFVTERGNPANCKKVKAAILEMPLAFLRRGLEFVDTPGVGSAIEANTETTYAFLPQCDAVLFVTSVDMPLTRGELQFLRTIRAHVRKIFFIVNKTDLLVDDHERAEVLEFVGRTIRETMKTEQVQILPISSRLGLAAAREHDPDIAARSGLPELQETLAHFLSEEKASVFLDAIIDKAFSLIEEESGELDLYQKARELPEQELWKRIDAIKPRLEQCAVARSKLFDQLRALLIKQSQDALAPDLESFLLSLNFSRRIERMLTHAGWNLCEPVAHRCTKGIIRRIRRQAWQLVCDHRTEINSESEGNAGGILKQLESNLSEIPLLATEALDLPHSKNMHDTHQGWRMDVKFDPPFLSDFDWTPRLSNWLRFMPVKFARQWLLQQLDSQVAGLLRTFQNATLEFIANCVGKAVDKFAGEVKAQAEEIESRITAALTGHRPPRPAWQRAMAPLAEPGWGNAALDSVRNTLVTLRDEISRAPETTPRPTEKTQIPPVAEKVPEPKPKDIAQDLKTRGCPVCDRIATVAWDFFSKWQYAISNDKSSQTTFVEERGFCPLHTWQLEAVSTTLGTSVGFARLVEQTALLLRQASQSQGSRSPVSRNKNCRVCDLLGKAEAEYITRLAEFLKEQNKRDLYASSQGVCLRHLDLLITGAVSNEISQFLLKSASHRFEEIAEDMQSYAIKRDATRSALANKDEADAWQRAITHLAGAKRNSAPWAKDGEI